MYFNMHVSVRDLYIPTFGPPISCSKYADRPWEYINRTQKHECRNWDCDRTVPFPGIYISNSRYNIFAVQGEVSVKIRRSAVRSEEYNMQNNKNLAKIIAWDWPFVRRTKRVKVGGDTTGRGGEAASPKYSLLHVSFSFFANHKSANLGT